MSDQDPSRQGPADLPSRGMTVRVVMYPGEDGYVIAECPEFPGCATQGRTREDALANVREAIEGWLDVQAQAGIARRQVEIVELAV